MIPKCWKRAIWWYGTLITVNNGPTTPKNILMGQKSIYWPFGNLLNIFFRIGKIVCNNLLIGVTRGYNVQFATLTWIHLLIKSWVIWRLLLLEHFLGCFCSPWRQLNFLFEGLLTCATVLVLALICHMFGLVRWALNS